MLYLFTVGSSDVETQRRGAVALSFVGPKVLPDVVPSQKQLRYHQSRIAAHTATSNAVPLRCIAIHGCLPDQYIYRILEPMYTMTMGAALSSKVKIHMGELTEFKYHLKSYGIPIELIPLTDTGNIKHTNFKQWLKLRRHLELLESSEGESWPRSRVGNQQQQQQQQQHRPTSVMDYLCSNDFRWSSQGGSLGYNGAERQQHRGSKHRPVKNRIVEFPGSNDVLFRRGKLKMTEDWFDLVSRVLCIIWWIFAIFILRFKICGDYLTCKIHFDLYSFSHFFLLLFAS